MCASKPKTLGSGKEGERVSATTFSGRFSCGCGNAGRLLVFFVIHLDLST